MAELALKVAIQELNNKTIKLQKIIDDLDVEKTFSDYLFKQRKIIMLKTLKIKLIINKIDPELNDERLHEIRDLCNDIIKGKL